MIPSYSIIEMRKRSVWEAADSGILLWKNNFFYFIPIFALPVWIIASLFMFIPDEFRWITWFGFSWLKPLYDRFCLNVVAVRFFKEPELNSHQTFQKIIKGLPDILFLHLAGDLLWRRFSPFRTTTMCLRLLERPKLYEERKKTLARGGLYFSALLSCLGPAIEIILLGGEIIFFFLISEIFFAHIPWYLRFDSSNISLYIFTAYCFNYILVGSLYVCMGFGIYINSRTEVEGWDIELLFRKLSGKIRHIGMILLLIFGLFAFYTPLKADDVLEPVPYTTLEEILASDDFGGTRPGFRVVLRERDTENGGIPEIDLAPWLINLREILAISLRALVIVIFISFTVFLIMLRLRRPKNISIEASSRVYANPIIKEENPEFYFDQAEEFYNQGLYKEAWASCLCGTIYSYSKYYNLSFPDYATEYDCLNILKSHYKRDENKDDKTIESFDDLIENWVLLAYGDRRPSEGSFEKAIEYGREIKFAFLKPVHLEDQIA